MSDWEIAPDYIVVDFLSAAVHPLTHASVGEAFIRSLGTAPFEPEKPLKLAVDKKKSKAGNPYYDFSQSSIPLPDGLSTLIRVEGVLIPLGKIKPSKNGNPTREGTALIAVGSLIFEATCYLTQGRNGFYVKIAALKKK